MFGAITLGVALGRSHNLPRWPFLLHFSWTCPLVQEWELENSTPLWHKCRVVEQRLTNYPCGSEGPSTYWDMHSLGLLATVRHEGPINNVFSIAWPPAARTINSMFSKRGKSKCSFLFTWDYIAPIPNFILALWSQLWSWLWVYSVMSWRKVKNRGNPLGVWHHISKQLIEFFSKDLWILCGKERDISLKMFSIL